jgi:hypothetical protein
LQSQTARDDGAQFRPHSVKPTLFRLDISNNADMNIEDVIVIQDSLIKNKQDYDD